MLFCVSVPWQTQSGRQAHSTTHKDPQPPQRTRCLIRVNALRQHEWRPHFQNTLPRGGVPQNGTQHGSASHPCLMRVRYSVARIARNDHLGTRQCVPRALLPTGAVYDHCTPALGHKVVARSTCNDGIITTSQRSPAHFLQYSHNSPATQSGQDVRTWKCEVFSTKALFQ